LIAAASCVDCRDVALVQIEIAGRRVFLDVRDTRRFGNREHVGLSREKRQDDLTRRRVMLGRYAFECRTSRARRTRKCSAAERRVRDDGNAGVLGGRYQTMLDSALFEMIEHLIARQWNIAEKVAGLEHFLRFEVGDADESGLAGADQVGHCAHRLAQWNVAGPVQQI
jgi:hypothetical protein